MWRNMFEQLRHTIKLWINTPPLGTWKKWFAINGVETRGIVHVYGKPHVVRSGDPTIILQDGVTLDSDPTHNEAGIIHPCTLAVSGHGYLHIGKDSGLSGVLICCEEKVIIGEHVGIGANVTIYDTDFHPINPWGRIHENNAGVVRKAVQIDDYAWIGANAMILKGVHIGRGAVIGAGSVVTKDVPELTIYAGNPARYVKDVDITEEQRKQLFG